MAKIKQLSSTEAQKIAAGEVVERPANVVKELIENSLDAKATAITLYIEDGGKQLIRVIDNGLGMDIEDARMSIKHHATSKITCVDDLETLETFGFRGEALSSICAVSKFTLTTKEAEAQTGICLEIEAGTIVKEEIIAGNAGTDIAIAELFYNIPARKKFLKTKETEWRAIVQLFSAFCLDYPEIHFKLYHDGKLVHNFPSATDLSMRLAQMYEKALTQHMLSVEIQDDKMNLRIKGAISTPQYHRYDRNQLFFFVNQRWVKNHKLSQALLRGYQNVLQTDRFPVAFIFISLNPDTVDINIHPRKEEVQFLHPRIVENLLETGVKKRLEEHCAQTLGATPLVRNTFTTPQPAFSRALEYTNQEIKQLKTAAEQAQEEKAFLEVLEKSFATQPFSQTDTQPAMQQPSVAQALEQLPLTQSILHQTPQADVQKPQYRLIGQTLLTYILIETVEGLVLIDQHAAHERVLYERLKKNFAHVPQIKLLFPEIITLSAHDLTTLSSYFELFKQFGVSVEQFSPTELVIQETPVFLKNHKLDDLVKQALGWIHEAQHIEPAQLKKTIEEKLHAQLSCKAAAKAGDELSIASMHELIKDLSNTENKLTCPHGRPTLWLLSKPEIEKKFKRDYR